MASTKSARTRQISKKRCKNCSKKIFKRRLEVLEKDREKDPDTPWLCCRCKSDLEESAKRMRRRRDDGLRREAVETIIPGHLEAMAVNSEIRPFAARH